MKMSRGKALFVILGIALVAVAGYQVMSNMWTSSVIHMHAAPSQSVTLALYEDCARLTPATAHDWDGVSQGQHYEWSLFVYNTGSMGLYITYLPTDVWFNDNQTHFIITVNVVKFGLPCQLNDVSVALQEKNYLLPTNGYFLPATKMIKLDIDLYVESTVSGGSYDWDFTVFGATG
jgi:hypothetical protein